MSGLRFCVALVVLGFAVGAHAQAPDLILVPGVRAGAVTKDTSLAQLKQIYGEKNVRVRRVDLRSSESDRVVEIFGSAPARAIYVVWNDPKEMTKPKAVVLRQQHSEWHTAEGVSVGQKMSELQALNGVPFKVWVSDYEGNFGNVADWNDGKLKALDLKTLELSFTLQEGIQLPSTDARSTHKLVKSIRVTELRMKL